MDEEGEEKRILVMLSVSTFCTSYQLNCGQCMTTLRSVIEIKKLKMSRVVIPCYDIDLNVYQRSFKSLSQ